MRVKTGFVYLSSPCQLSFISWLKYVQFQVSTSSVSHNTISQQGFA